MKKIDYKSFLSTIATIFIIVLIVTLGPANAVTISVSTPANVPQFNQVTTFNAKIDLATNERVPFNNVSATIRDESNAIVARCYFDVNGNKLSPCDASFVSISRLDSTITSQGDMNGTGFGTNGILPDGIYTTDFGYGYGFAENGVTNELEYQISWRTPNVIIAAQTYTIEVEANAKDSGNSFTYKLQTPATIAVAMMPPIANLASFIYEAPVGTILDIDASLSTDPNSLTLTNYTITKNGIVIDSSSGSQLEIPVDFVGLENFNLTVTNSVGLVSSPVEFSVTGISDFNAGNFRLDVENLIKNGNMKFTVTPLVDFNKTKVRVKPYMECLNIRFDYKEDYIPTKLILKKANKEYPLVIQRGTFDLRVPMENDCNFKVVLLDTQSGEEVVLSKKLQFYDSIEQVPTGEDIDVAIDNGNELINYIYTSFGKSFQTGYNSLNFNFKNERRTDIEAEITWIVPNLNLQNYERIVVNANSDSKVTIPFFVSEDVKPGLYPMRISYRINEGELKTKYGFIEIED